MRVIAGLYKGRRLSAGPDLSIRPTTDRAKEFIFNFLVDFPAGKRVVDIFAGSGGLGIEALSCGAQHCTFVEKSSDSIRVLRKNLDSIKIPTEKFTIIQESAESFIKLNQSEFELYLLDPPFKITGLQSIVDDACSVERFKAGQLIIIEHETSNPISLHSDFYAIFKQKKNGKKSYNFFNQENRMNQPIIAIYPGTFDPITLGHIDVISRASNIFDVVIVTLAINQSKKPLFSVEERIEMIKNTTDAFSNVKVEKFDGLVVNFAHKHNAKVLIRGLRALTDFEYEFQMALMNRKLDNDITTVFLMPNEKYTYLNSTIVKDVAKFKGNIDSFVTKFVADKIYKKVQ